MFKQSHQHWTANELTWIWNWIHRHKYANELINTDRKTSWLTQKLTDVTNTHMWMTVSTWSHRYANDCINMITHLCKWLYQHDHTYMQMAVSTWSHRHANDCQHDHTDMQMTVSMITQIMPMIVSTWSCHKFISMDTNELTRDFQAELALASYVSHISSSLVACDSLRDLGRRLSADLDRERTACRHQHKGSSSTQAYVANSHSKTHIRNCSHAHSISTVRQLLIGH